MQRDKRETTFSITNKNDRSWIYTGYNYCFKGEKSYISLFYSYVEDLWVIVANIGWIKVNGRVVESIVYIKNNCVIDFENISYIFTSHKATDNGCSKVISSTISSSDRKKISKAQVMYYLRNVKGFTDAETAFAYNSLQKNKIFKVKDDIWELDYYHYGLIKYHSIYEILFSEYLYRLNSREGFKLYEVILNPDFKKIPDNIKPKSTLEDLAFINSDVFEVEERFLTSLRSQSDLLDHIRTSLGVGNDDMVHSQWIKVFFSFANKPNLRKRKLETVESVKKKCLIKIEDLETDMKIQCLTEHKQVEQLRNSFTADISDGRFRRKKTQRSFSLIEEQDKDSENIWVFERKSRDDFDTSGK